MTMGRLRKQMIHDYIEEPVVLAHALEGGHPCVPVLVDVTARVSAELERGVWVSLKGARKGARLCSRSPRQRTAKGSDPFFGSAVDLLVPRLSEGDGDGGPG
jgi:hypothetical protein